MISEEGGLLVPLIRFYEIFRHSSTELVQCTKSAHRESVTVKSSLFVPFPCFYIVSRNTFTFFKALPNLI